MESRGPTERRLAPAEFAALVGLSLLLMGLAFAAGLFASPYVRAQVAPAPTPTDAVREQFEIFWQAWNVVEEHYVRPNAIDPREMTYGAIRGMLDSLEDQGHTRFLDPEDVRLEEASLRGRFEGIGAEVTMRDGRPTIVAPIDSSPAEQAGLRPGDVILRVDDQDVSEWTLTELVTRIRGSRGSIVRLTVARDGEAHPLTFSLVRDEIQVDAVTWAMIPASPYAHVRISQFSETSASELREALQQARAAGAEGLIVDVRNNPGGLLDQVIAITSEFVPSGNVLLQEDREGNRRPFPVRGGGVATDLPLVVLVNEGSASASEILAGAIQDHRRGTVIGEKTFGTGTVLNTYSLSDGSAILLGTAQWLTPNGRVIWKQGITPDETVSLDPDAQAVSPRQWRTMTTADLQASGDVQIQQAIEVLRSYRQPPVANPISGGRSTLRPVLAY